MTSRACSCWWSTAVSARALTAAFDYLFPGKTPGRPRNAAGTHHLLQQHGLPVLTARNTAMIEAVTSLPPIVVADLFGMNITTAQRWANYAKDGCRRPSQPA